MPTLIMPVQMQTVWHRQGLFMGMHWAWWLFWIATALIVLWALWRLAADRQAARREVAHLRHAESTLRERHARGEIDQDQLVESLTALFAPGSRPAGTGWDRG